MFYVKWFGQVMLVMVLISILALLVPPPAVTGLLLIGVIVWAVWLLRSLVRYLAFPNAATPHRRRRKRSDNYVLGAQVALSNSVTVPAEFFDRPPVAQRVQAKNAASTKRTCSSRMNARVPRESRGRSFPASFVYCRARRRLPAA
jgi:biopolymer transport protein ExbB/TolQ